MFVKNAFQSKCERWWFVLDESESTLKCWQYRDQAQQKEVLNFKCVM